MNFIQTYVLQPPVWMFNTTFTNKLEIDTSQEFDRFYEELMSEIIRSLWKVEKAEDACEGMLSVNEFLESMQDVYKRQRIFCGRATFLFLEST